MPKDDHEKSLAFLNAGTGVDLMIVDLVEAVAIAVDYKSVMQWDTIKPEGTPKKQLDVRRMQALGLWA